MISPKFFTTSELSTTSRGKSKKVYLSPTLEKVVDYTKNISEEIFSPCALARDFRSSIPEFARPKSAISSGKRYEKQIEKRKIANKSLYVTEPAMKHFKLKKMENELRKSVELRKSMENEVKELKSLMTSVGVVLARQASSVRPSSK